MNGRLKLSPGSRMTRRDLAELQHQRLLGLIDDEERTGRQDADDDQQNGDDGEQTMAHQRRPVVGRAPLGPEDAAEGAVVAAGGALAPGWTRLGSGR